MRLIAFACVIGVSALALAKPPRSPTVTHPGALVIKCPTDGAEVIIDGNKVGVTPLQPLVLPPGEHTIKIVRLGFAPLIDVFSINKTRETRLDVELVPIAGVVKVTANVEGANVFIDGKFVGQAPVTADMEVGPRSIQVSKGGYKDYFQNLNAVAGQEVSVEVMLEELPEGANPYKPPPPPPPKWYEKWWVWTAGAGGVAVLVTVIVVPVVTSQKDPIADFNASYNFTVTVPERR